MRKWYKMIPPKKVQEEFGIYQGTWNPQLDRCWESDDGYSVMSRLIQTDWGKMEHITIHRLGSKGGDIPWAVKQQIKNELFDARRVAIEVFPSEKNLVDVMDIYHLWLLPKDFRLPFGIHPTRDPQCRALNRGYDYDLMAAKEWADSKEREELMK